MGRRDRGHGPDNLGDDEQETEVGEYEQYVADPRDKGIEIAEDNDNDAEAALDWAARHPKAAIKEPEPSDVSAEQAAMHEIRGS
jgi:hypothetical protein